MSELGEGLSSAEGPSPQRGLAKRRFVFADRMRLATSWMIAVAFAFVAAFVLRPAPLLILVTFLASFLVAHASISRLRGLAPEPEVNGFVSFGTIVVVAIALVVSGISLRSEPAQFATALAVASGLAVGSYLLLEAFSPAPDGNNR